MNLDIMALLIKLYFQITLSSCKNHHTMAIKYVIKHFIKMNKANIDNEFILHQFFSLSIMYISNITNVVD